MIKKIFSLVLKRKIISSVIAVVLVFVGYSAVKNLTAGQEDVRYVLAAAEIGNLITSISGSGQVSVSGQVELKPKISGDLLNLAAANGQEVKAGTVLFWFDSTEAQKAVRDAENSLASAELSLAKLKQSADSLTILQAENSLAQAQESKQKAQDDLKKAYDDGFNTVADAFLDLPTVMSGIYGMLFGTNFSANQTNIDYYVGVVKPYDEKILQYQAETNAAYQAARLAYDQSFDGYKAASRYSSTDVIESLITQTYEATKDIAEMVKSVNNLIQFYQDKVTNQGLTPVALSNTHLASLSSYTGQTNSHLLNLLSIQNSIKTDKETIINSDRTIAERIESLVDLKAGADPLDIQSQELTLQQRQNALVDARAKLADYAVRAPFDGVVVNLSVKKGESVSTGTTVATLITKQKLAEISLNEVDAAKVKVGQKVTLTFDAIEDLSLTGEVAEIDTLGTVTQGVVTYNVKIVFDTQDERVKPGMSVSASIITNFKADVLLIPNGAVKSFADSTYVQMPDETLGADATNNTGVILKNVLRQQPIQIGLANESSTEVTEGLAVGNLVVIRTINSAATTNQASQGQTLFQAAGSSGGNRSFGSGGSLR